MTHYNFISYSAVKHISISYTYKNTLTYYISLFCILNMAWDLMPFSCQLAHYYSHSFNIFYFTDDKLNAYKIHNL